MYISGISAAVNIGLNLVLIPKMGIEGAAIATSVAVFTGCVIDYTDDFKGYFAENY